MSGLYPATNGDITINGSKIDSNMSAVRSSLGVCPQFNALFDELTVEEHLWFYCKLKGYNDNLIESEINNIIKSLQMESKRHTQSYALSGGMQRKLSVSNELFVR